MDLNALPLDILHDIKQYITFKPKTKNELQKAVDVWCDDKDNAIELYGHISLWNTELITDMSKLFHNKPKFNDDISCWNVDNVTNMNNMFNNAKSFNQPLNEWSLL